MHVPRHEVSGAALQFRVMEERVVKGSDGKRGGVSQCQACVTVALPWALHCSEPPPAAVAAAAAQSEAGQGAAAALSPEDVCACWYPLAGVGGSGGAARGGKGKKRVKPLRAAVDSATYRHMDASIPPVVR